MDIEAIYTATDEIPDVAFRCEALFDQYDEPEIALHANDDSYENLYPNVA
jgi:hypothetical protein